MGEWPTMGGGCGMGCWSTACARIAATCDHKSRMPTDKCPNYGDQLRPAPQNARIIVVLTTGIRAWPRVGRIVLAAFGTSNVAFARITGATAAIRAATAESADRYPGDPRANPSDGTPNWVMGLGLGWL